MTRLRSVRVATAVAAALGIGLCFSPLLGVHGVESALVLGVILPPFVAAAAARAVATRRASGTLTPAAIASETVAIAVLVWAVPTLVLALDSLRIRQCAPGMGLAFMVLGPLLGCGAAAAVGAVVALLVPRPRLATTLAALVPVAAVLLGLHRFWSSPAIFVYGTFAGWFPGTIYDEGVTIPIAYLTFRVGTVALALGLVCTALAFFDPASGRPSRDRWRAAPGLAATGLLSLLSALAIDLYGEELGHRSSTELIARELGATARGERCIVHAPRELPRAELRRLVEDCDHRVVRSERALGVHQRTRVTAMFFRSAEEKALYMGAAGTFIAKPWRDEVYLQLAGWPHPVLFHEIVHVVAGNAAVGPFRVAGRAGGLLPDPALIEGVAVAIAWEEREGLTPHEWARAMLDLGIMPRLDDVVGLSFLGQPARNAYTVAGSFVRWLLDEHGARAIREAYRTGDLEAATGQTIAALERRWRAFLTELTLPPAAMELAEARFSERSIFSAVCPHAIARRGAELSLDLAAGDDRAAIRSCREILAIDPANASVRALSAGALARAGRQHDAEAELATLGEDPPAPEPVRALAEQLVADAAWLRGNRRAALAAYRRLLERPQSEEAARQIEVRILAIESGGEDERLVRDLLLGNEGLPAPAPVVVHHARTLALSRADGLGPYLAARQLSGVGRHDLALPLIREAGSRGMPTERLAREQQRMLGSALVAEGELAEAARLLRSIARAEGASAGDRARATDWLLRIRWMRDER